MPIIVGGVGGGGDVGLSAILVEDQGLQGSVVAVVSFGKCTPGKRAPGRRVAGALHRLDPREDYGRRVFEDKLARVAPWARQVYMLCTKAGWDDLTAGMRWVVERFAPSCLLYSDLGGDALLLGYEERLGSYRTDAIARALLAWASETLGVPSVLALGGVGAEGGGGELDPVEVAAALQFLHDRGVLLGVLLPGVESLWIARALLGEAESGMLPLYVEAVRGAREARIDSAYLHGTVRVEPWYKYVFLADALGHCRLSPLCTQAHGRGWEGLRRYTPPRPPREYRLLLGGLRRRARREGADSVARGVILRVADNLWGRGLPGRCRV